MILCTKLLREWYCIKSYHDFLRYLSPPMTWDENFRGKTIMMIIERISNTIS